MCNAVQSVRRCLACDSRASTTVPSATSNVTRPIATLTQKNATASRGRVREYSFDSFLPFSLFLSLSYSFSLPSPPLVDIVWQFKENERKCVHVILINDPLCIRRGRIARDSYSSHPRPSRSFFYDEVRGCDPELSRGIARFMFMSHSQPVSILVTTCIYIHKQSSWSLALYIVYSLEFQWGKVSPPHFSLCLFGFRMWSIVRALRPTAYLKILNCEM